MDRIEFLDGLCIRVVEAGIRQLALTDVDDHEGHVETTSLHLRQVHLGAEIHRVVLLSSEVGSADVVVGIQRDRALVDASCTSYEIGFRFLRGLTATAADERGQSHKRENARTAKVGVSLHAHRFGHCGVV